MNQVPDNAKIYHITHAENLPRILAAGVVWSDAKRLKLGLSCKVVGMSEIKRRRLNELEVKCRPGTMVGEYVPFYFCPRSIMLYILYKGNHPDLVYSGGQGPIVHLQADMAATIQWADANGFPWAFSDRNAGTSFARFYNSLADLDKISWAAVEATDFRDMMVKEGKQAEFLFYESFPWELVEKIGVQNASVLDQVGEILREADNKPMANIEPDWYY